MNKSKKIWIIGGSSGIGLELVKLLLENNHYVIVSSRNATSNKELELLSKNYQDTLYRIDLDVNANEFSKEINEAWNVFDGIDIWFYNAASYEVMSLQQWDKDKFIQMNSTNYLAVVKFMDDILPFFKKQGSGKWVWNLSLSSYFGLPKGGGYSAPKAALLNLAQSIHPELSKIGITMQVINHGFVKTRLTNKNDFEMPQLMSPEYAAKEIFERVLNNNNFEISFPFKLGFFLKLLNILPYKISLAITKKMLR